MIVAFGDKTLKHEDTVPRLLLGSEPYVNYTPYHKFYTFIMFSIDTNTGFRIANWIVANINQNNMSTGDRVLFYIPPRDGSYVTFALFRQGGKIYPVASRENFNLNNFASKMGLQLVSTFGVKIGNVSHTSTSLRYIVDIEKMS